MVLFKASALLLLANGAHASSTFIAGYEPRSSVTDHNAIDLDQQAIEIALAGGDYASAREVYEDGAHSKSVATVTLLTPLTGPLQKGTAVSGTGMGGGSVSGALFEDTVANTQTIRIQYATSDVQSTYVGCQVGGNPDPNFDGCFAESGTLSIEGLGDGTQYQYDMNSGNANERTIQGFSTSAKEKQYICANCPYLTYEKFYDYYGEFDYADRWVLAAFEERPTDLARGNANFANLGNDGRNEAIKKGTAYMNIFMYVIREMEDAIDDCQSNCDVIGSCNDDPVHAWDEAVAFYTGSLELNDGSGDGKLMYALADKRCANFRTCGDLGKSDIGTSHVNMEIFRQFEAGLRHLLNGECSELRPVKERIEQLMAVPLIQGTLRYAYKQAVELDSDEKSEAEGATFAAAVLPIVYACDNDDADNIYNVMRIGHRGLLADDFDDVKSAFERNYKCMGVRCEDVGGLWDGGQQKFYDGAEPCGSSSASTAFGYYGIGFTVTLVAGVIGLIL